MRLFDAARITRAAQRGAKLLDKVEPSWFQMVDLTILNMGSLSCCVLGQAYGDYMEGLLRLETRADDAGRRVKKRGEEMDPYYYGFSILDVPLTAVEWSALTEAWIEEIRARMGR